MTAAQFLDLAFGNLIRFFRDAAFRKGKPQVPGSFRKKKTKNRRPLTKGAGFRVWQWSIQKISPTKSGVFFISLLRFSRWTFWW